MATVKSFLTILYLLLYGCFCTADISISQVSQVEKGISLSKDFLQTINVVAGAISEYKEKDLASLFGMLGKVFHSLGKVAASIGFIGSLISFIFAFIPKSNPMFEFMKEQFAQVNRKLDSLSLQISTLQTEIEWTTYASTYGKDENVIKNSWAKLTEFIKTAPVASTQEEKTRLAERFTTFYENTGTENSIANFHRYLTENSPVSLNKNLLKLVIEKSNGDFNVLVQYSTYFTTLMVSGLKLNVFYYKLKGYDGEAKAQEAVTQLYNTLSSIQDALIECAGDFEKWAYKDAVKISSQRFSDTKTLTSDIKNHLERKFHWFKWVVIAHSKEAKNEFTFGRSIYVDVQEKTSVHLIHQEKGSAVDQIIKENVRSSLQKELSQIIPLQCETMKAKLLHRFGAKIISHTRFLHAVTKPSDYAQTDMADIEMNCQSAHRNFNFFLKGKNIVVKPPCSDVNCNNGECKSIKDTTIVFCKCHKMFHGPACEESVQNIINYESLEGEINAIMFKLVPDLTAIYFSIKELKDYTKAIVESVRHDIQWTQIFVKYSNVIQKFRYINTLHTQLKNSTINQRHYISEVGAQFTGGNSFEFYLTDFHQMMMGTGFGDRQNVLEFFHKSLVQDQSGGQAECTKYYSDRIDYFVRYMFALEMEAVLLAFGSITLHKSPLQNTSPTTDPAAFGRQINHEPSIMPPLPASSSSARSCHQQRPFTVFFIIIIIIITAELFTFVFIGEYSSVSLIVLISAVGSLLIVAFGIFCIFRKHRKIDKQDVIIVKTVHSHSEITYADPTSYKRKAQKTRVQEEDEVVYSVTMRR
ncbi:SE-cephalotoxin [Labeo rohita]|uniref:SE-cephalotoxin n=1 Tax=Labeo rohita TaxID=84645 RepID=UPI0021E2F3A6|nr:SE-cephalotoxin [Labeo rohita]